jgi:hypothetical protein
MDTGLLKSVVVGAGRSRRDRLLVLLVAVTGFSVERLLSMTWREVWACLEYAHEVPHGKWLRALMIQHAEDHPEAGDKDLFFASRKRHAGGERRSISRVQAWRVVSRSLLSAGLGGGFKVLRGLSKGLRFRLPPILVDEGLDDLFAMIESGVIPVAAHNRGLEIP